MKYIYLIVLFTSAAYGATNAHRLTGRASYYHDRYEGRLTASGKVFSQNTNYAAHCTLPFGTRVRVTNLNNGRSCIVVIEDRGPFDVKNARKGILTPHPTRIIDLSRVIARKLGFERQGITSVRLDILPKPMEQARSPPAG